MSKKVLSPVSTSPLPAPKYSAPAPVILSPVATASIPTIKCSTPPRALEDGEQLLKNFYYRQTTEGQNDIVGGATNHDLGLRTKCASEEECCPIIFDGPCCLSTPAPSLSAGTSSVTLGDVVFSNSNSVSFGLSGRTVTASFAGGGSGGAPFAISASGSSVSSGTVVFSNANSFSFGMVGSTITASYIPGSGSQTVQPGIQSISGGTTRVTTGEVIFSNSNGLSFGVNGQTITGSYTVPVQSTQTENCVDLSFAGNTSGALALISSGTAIFAGGNNITLSQNGQSVTISAANFSQTVQTQNVVDVSLSGNTSGALALISSGTAIFAGGNNITLSQNGQSITISAANSSQTIQTQNLVDLSLSGNTSGVLALISSGTAIFAGGNNITLSQDGQSVTISAANQTVQTQNVVDVTLSGNTTGTLALVSSGTLTLAGGNNITLSQSGNKITISGPNTVAQTVQTQNCVDMSLSGNTSGTLALISSGTAVLAGGNNITLSQDGQSVTISAFNQTVQTQNLIDATLAGNTTGTLALISSGTLTLAGGNNITLSQNGNAVTISAPNTVSQTVQTQNCVDLSLSGNTSGTLALISSGTAILAGGNNITLSQNGQSITISAFTQTIQTQNLVDVTISGNTSGTSVLVSSGTLTLAGGNNITLSQSGNAITISGPNTSAQTVQTQNCVDMSIAGNTSGTKTLISSGTAILAGGNNITLSQNGQSITISALNMPINSIIVTDNKDGTNATITGGAIGSQILFSLVPAANISFQDLNGGGSNTSDGIAVFAPIYEFGISNLGNTSGTTGTWGGSITDQYGFFLAGGNNITLSQHFNTAAASFGTITISAANQTVQTQNCVDMSIAGNTSGTKTLISSGTAILAGGNNITLSQNGQSITISAFNESVQTQNCVDLSLAGNTSGTLTIISSGTGILAGGNNITLSQNGQSVTISAFNQTNQTLGLYMSSNTTSSVSSGTVDARSMTFRGVGNVSVGYSNGEVILSGATAATAIAFSAGASSANLSSLIFSNSNNISFGLSGSTVTASASAQSVQTQNCVDLSIGGNTSGTSTIISSGTAILLGGNNITLSQSGQSITISAFNQTVQTQNCVDVSLAGNTSGTLTIVSSGTAILAGGNNITLSQDGQSVTISAFNQTVQTQNCVDLSIGGNTSGTSTIISSGTAILLGGNNITLSQNGQSITISAFSSNPGTLSLYQNIPSMVNMVTGLSAITVTSGSSIFVQPFVLPNYQSIGYVRLLASLNDSAVGTGGTTSLNTTASVERYTTIAIVIYSQGVGASSNSIQSLASTSVGITGRTIFSMGNGGGASSYTLTLQKTYPNTGAANVNYTTSYNVNSGSIVISSNSNTLFTGPQFIDIPFATSLTPGNYWLGIGASTSSNSNSALISFAGTCAMPISLAAISQSNVSVGLMGQATSASQYQLQLGLGLWTTNASVISTGSIGLNSISQLVSNRQIPFQFIRQA